MSRILFIGLFVLIPFSAICQIEGEVMDEKEKAIVNAIVIAHDTTGKSVDTVKTDERGFYCFKGLKPGKYRVEGKAPGFVAQTETMIVRPTPEGANDADDTYYAEIVDFILKRPKK